MLRDRNCDISLSYGIISWDGSFFGEVSVTRFAPQKNPMAVVFRFFTQHATRHRKPLIWW